MQYISIITTSTFIITLLMNACYMFIRELAFSVLINADFEEICLIFGSW
jgi:hypothetical protein